MWGLHERRYGVAQADAKLVPDGRGGVLNAVHRGVPANPLEVHERRNDVDPEFALHTRVFSAVQRAPLALEDAGPRGWKRSQEQQRQDPLRCGILQQLDTDVLGPVPPEQPPDEGVLLGPSPAKPGHVVLQAAGNAGAHGALRFREAAHGQASARHRWGPVVAFKYDSIMSSTPIASLRELCDESTRLINEKRLDDEAHDAYRGRVKARAARQKELRALIGALLTESDMDCFHHGDRVFTRSSKPVVRVNTRRVRKFMGQDAFQEYADSNVDYDERVRVKTKRSRH